MQNENDTRAIKIEPLEQQPEKKEAPAPKKKGKKDLSAKQRAHIEKLSKARSRKKVQREIIRKVSNEMDKKEISSEIEFKNMVNDLFKENDNQLDTPAHKQALQDSHKEDKTEPSSIYKENEITPTYEEGLYDSIISVTPTPSRNFKSPEDPFDGYDVIL